MMWRGTISALVLRNRAAGPLGLFNMANDRCGGEFDAIDDVIPEAERKDFMAKYKSAAGFARDTQCCRANDTGWQNGSLLRAGWCHCKIKTTFSGDCIKVHDHAGLFAFTGSDKQSFVDPVIPRAQVSRRAWVRI
jgi:hypothetical protein